MRSLFPALTIVPLLAACVGGPTHYGLPSLDAIKPDVTHERDLVAVFGMPTFNIPARDKGRLWTWQYTPDQAEEHDGLLYMTILLDSDGRVVRIVKVVRM